MLFFVQTCPLRATQAFRTAAGLGIFIAMSAGNNGAAGLGTVSNNFPWVVTVGAGTHDRENYWTAVVGERTYRGGTSLEQNGGGKGALRKRGRRRHTLLRHAPAAGIAEALLNGKP